MLRYLDNSLSGQKLEDFQAHLQSCADCRLLLDNEQALSSLLRGTRPLYAAPQSLRARVALATERAYAGAGGAEPVEVSRGWASRGWTGRTWDAIQAALGWKPAVAILVVAVLALVFLPEAFQRVRATEYIQAAAEIHRSYVAGDLPLQCRSNSPGKVTAWFADKTPFHFELPTSHPAINGKSVYWLTGARMVNYKGRPTAFVAYETQTEKVSLLVAPADLAVAAGGQVIKAGDLMFHYRTEANFEVITWSNHGLTYALWSSPLGSAQHSSMVCHQDLAGGSAFRPEASITSGLQVRALPVHQFHGRFVPMN